MRLAYSNFIDAIATTDSIVASTEDSSYPVTNVIDQRLTTKWHSDDTTTQTVVIDLGATAACSIFAIISHNIASSVTTTVVGNDQIASGLTWVTSDQSSVQTITYNADMMLSFITPLSNRYWKFTFAGLTEELEIGRLWIGNYIDISPSSLNDFQVTLMRDDTVVYGRNRQKYASIGSQWRKFDLTFPRTKSTAISAIQTFYETVGNHTSFIFCNFDSLRGYSLVEPCYCSVSGEIGFTHARQQFYTYSLTIEEDL